MADLASQLEQLGGVSMDAAPSPAQPTPTPDAAPAPSDLDSQLAQLGGVNMNAPATSEPGQPDAPGKTSDLAGAAIRGLKQTLAPFLLTKDDLQGEKTGGEIATEVGTNIASDVALGAGVGMIVGPEGAVAGAAAGALVHAAMAAYRGFGYEAAQAKAKGQAFDPVRGLVNTATQLNPLIGMGNRLTKGAIQALGEFVSNYQYSGDQGSAGTAAAMGGIVAALTHQNTGTLFASMGAQAARPGSQTQRAGVTPAQMSDMIEAVADRSATGIASRAEQAIEDMRQTTPEYFELGDKLKDSQLSGAPAQLKSEMDTFKRWYLDKPGMGVQNGDLDGSFYDARRRFGDNDLSKQYELWQTQKLTNKATEDFNVEVGKDLLGVDKDGQYVNRAAAAGEKLKTATMPDDPLSNNWLDKLRDIKFTMRKIDDMLGTNFEGMVDNFSAAKNQHNAIMAPFLYRANKLVAMGRKVGLTNEDVGRWLAEEDINKNRAFLHSTKVDDLGDKAQSIAAGWDDKQKALAEGWRTLFEDARTTLKNQGLSIDFLNQQTFADGGKYLPTKQLSGAQGAKALRMEAQRLEDSLGSDYLKSQQSYDLRRSVSKMLNARDGTDIEPDQIMYRNQVAQAEQHMLSPSFKASDGFEAHMAFQRTPGLPAPEFIRDYDVGKLFTGYMNNGLKSVLYRDPFTQLHTSLETLDGMGFKQSRVYLENYIQSISGSPSNFMAGITNMAQRHKDMFEKMIENVDTSAPLSGATTGALKAARDLPDFVGFAISSIYPNFLGLNVRAALRDLTKPFLLTAPELGWGYGGSTVTKVIMKAAWQRVRGMVDFEDELKKLNLMPAAHQALGGDLTDSGMRAVKGMGGALENLDRFNHGSMWLYSQNDKTNRYIQLEVGRQIARDAEAGHPRALDYLSRMMSEGNRKGVRDILDNGGSWSDIGDELGAQLVAKTSFNYGKEGMNEFGRDMGRLFSMFTKWPAMIMSDTGDLVSRYGKFGGSVKVAQRYMLPMAAMMMAGEYMLDTEHNPWQRFLIGKNLAEWSPMSSWKIGTPPLLQTSQDFSKALLDTFSADKDRHQKLDEWGKFLGRNATAYMPGMQVKNEYDRYQKAFHPESDK